MLGLTQPNLDLKNKCRINESTIATEYIGPLEAVHCYTRRVRYDMVVQCGASGQPELGLSGHLRRCSIADSMRSLHEQCHISFYTIVTVLMAELQFTSSATGTEAIYIHVPVSTHSSTRSSW
eukprot:scaffold5065_cov134-Skeletonema_marinoi.AAC.3